MKRRGPGVARAKVQQGVALVAVLWIVAALSILVTGLVQTQREEIRTASSVRARLSGDAFGQAAIQLVVQRMRAQTEVHSRLASLKVPYGGMDIQVEIQPLTGLVDLNMAPAPLLAALFRIRGLLDGSAAERVAAALVAMREARPAGPPPRFHAPEELLAVEGIDYDVYARLAHLVTADSRGSGRVNPLAAPPEVLLVLAGGDPALASRVAADRDADVAGMDTTRLQVAFTDNSASSRFRFRAYVAVPDGTEVIVVRDIDISPAAEGTAPWRTMRKHAPVIRLNQGRST